ncbi:MAG: phosphoribosylanthranilate isomerase [Saprospiraceae bacterium]|jgi:phosphoribosylanthranilate isomerase
MTQVKICCISSIQEAKMAIENGANILGLVGPMPSGPGIISNEQIAEIAQSVPTHIYTWLLTSETSAEKIIAHYNLVNTNAIQIVDKLKKDEYQKIKDTLPGIKLIQVLHVLDESTIDEARRIAKYVDYILLDSGNPKGDIKILGGTGKVHNWEISKKVVNSVEVPVFLAGGLNGKNVVAAIGKVQPFGVDLCSGVRTENRLDHIKLKSFFQNIRTM